MAVPHCLLKYRLLLAFLVSCSGRLGVEGGSVSCRVPRLEAGRAAVGFGRPSRVEIVLALGAIGTPRQRQYFLPCTSSRRSRSRRTGTSRTAAAQTRGRRRRSAGPPAAQNRADPGAHVAAAARAALVGARDAPLRLLCERERSTENSSSSDPTSTRRAAGIPGRKVLPVRACRRLAARRGGGVLCGGRAHRALLALLQDLLRVARHLRLLLLLAVGLLVAVARLGDHPAARSGTARARTRAARRRRRRRGGVVRLEEGGGAGIIGVLHGERRRRRRRRLLDAEQLGYAQTPASPACPSRATKG